MGAATRALRRSGTAAGRLIGYALVCGLVDPSAATGAEIAEMVGRPIVEVALVSEGRTVDDAAVRELLETRVGQPLSMRQVRESLTHLFSLGTLESVAVDGDIVGDGVVLRYELVPRQLVDRIELDGALGLSAGEIRDVIRDTYGTTIRHDNADLVAETVRRFYQRRGFLRSVVGARVNVEGGDRVLRVEATAGPRAAISRIIVRGVSPTQYSLVLQRLGLETGQGYDGVEIERRLADYERELRERRYYEASLSHDIERVDGGQAVHLLLDVQRGPRIAIAFEGDELPGADPAELVPVEREGSVDEDLLEDSDRRIVQFLNDLGYRDATVRHERKTEGDELTIVFSVAQGRPYEIGTIMFTGNRNASPAQLEELLGLQAGRPLVVRELEAGLAAIIEFYHELGFATVRAEPTIGDPDRPGADGSAARAVPVTFAIEEGVRTTIQSAAFEGNTHRSEAELREVIASSVGGVYYNRQIVADREAIQLLYLNDGFERVTVSVEPRFSEGLNAVDLVFRVSEGPQIRVEHILIVGNDGVDSDTIRRELAIEAGQPLGLADVSETRRRLNALGVFRRIDIRDFSHGGGYQRDVVVVVEEAPATTLGYGGGVEVSQRLRREGDVDAGQAVERIEFAPRGFFEIGRRNLWGRNRSINLFTRVSLRRKNDPIDPSAATDGNRLGFNEYRVLATYREPRTFGLAWDVFVTGFVEQAIRTGFDLFSRGINAEIRRQLTPTINVSASYGLGQNDTSNKQLSPEDEPIVDRLFEELRLSSFSGSVLRDTRNDPFDPSSGQVLSVDGQLAARSIGSEVGFLKTFMQAFTYHEVPGAQGVVFAGGARLGLAAGFPRVVEIGVTPLPPSGVGVPVQPPSTFTVPLPDRSLPLSQRFFAGGDRTVRGFALDRLGVPPGEPGATINAEGFPQGGNALIVLNGELRVPITGALGVVGFVDAGNVYDLVSNISLSRIRTGVGFGVRYRSPLGPIRVDLGFKLDRREFGSGDTTQREPLTALHISIGQAF